jgi:hypothetical protein
MVAESLSRSVPSCSSTTAPSPALPGISLVVNRIDRSAEAGTLVAGGPWSARGAWLGAPAERPAALSLRGHATTATVATINTSTAASAPISTVRRRGGAADPMVVEAVMTGGGPVPVMVGGPPA